MSQNVPPNFDSNLPPPDGDAIDRYLDDAMPVAERVEFEKQIAESESIRSQIELQRRVDASLNAGFGAPPIAALLTREEAQAFAPKSRKTGWSREYKMFGALAALLAIAVSIQAYLWLSSAGNAPERPTLAETYFKLVDHKFQPTVECTTRDKFAEWMQARYGVALAPKEERADVKLLGWSYSRAISNYTGLLLATVEGKPVVVAFDTLDRQSEWGYPCRRQPNDKGGLNFFSAQIDGIAVYEITPLDQPRIIDNLGVLKAP